MMCQGHDPISVNYSCKVQSARKRGANSVNRLVIKDSSQPLSILLRQLMFRANNVNIQTHDISDHTVFFTALYYSLACFFAVLLMYVVLIITRGGVCSWFIQFKVYINNAKRYSEIQTELIGFCLLCFLTKDTVIFIRKINQQDYFNLHCQFFFFKVSFM